MFSLVRSGEAGSSTDLRAVSRLVKREDGWDGRCVCESGSSLLVKEQDSDYCCHGEGAVDRRFGVSWSARNWPAPPKADLEAGLGGTIILDAECECRVFVWKHEMQRLMVDAVVRRLFGCVVQNGWEGWNVHLS